MSDPTHEIDELIEQEKRQALALFDAHPFEVGRAARAPAARPPVRFALVRPTVLVAAAALVVTAVTVTVRDPVRQAAPRLRAETVERALRGAPTDPTARASGGSPATADLARTVEAALWRSRGRTSQRELERIVVAALGGRATDAEGERPWRLDRPRLQRRIERLGGGLLEDVLRRHWPRPVAPSS